MVLIYRYNRRVVWGERKWAQRWGNVCENPAPFLSCISFLPLFGPLPWNILILYANSTLLKRPAVCQNDNWPVGSKSPATNQKFSRVSPKVPELVNWVAHLENLSSRTFWNRGRMDLKQTNHTKLQVPSLTIPVAPSNGCIPLGRIREDSRWVNQPLVSGSPKFCLSTSTHKNVG